MSEGTPITIKSVETKSGVSAAGKAWTLFKIEAAEGGKFSTFDAALGNLAQASAGRTALVTFESTEKGNNLRTLSLTTPTVQTPPPVVQQATPAQTWPESDPVQANGGPDWDLIGLRKTRCALWVAVLSNASLNVAGADALAAFGRELVIAAENDIFNRTAGSEGAGGGFVHGDDIPFARTFS